ncbi:site-specific recombinase XerD [Rhizobium ruizarguesonis]
MAIRQRGTTWQADVRVAANQNPTGKEVRLRLAAANKDAATALEARARLAIIETGCFDPAAGNAPKVKGMLKDALQLAWSSKAGRKGGWSMQRAGEQSHRNASVCVDFLGPTRSCRSITSKDLDNLVHHFRDLGLSSGTVRVKVACFYRLLAVAEKEGWVDKIPKYERPSAGAPREFILSTELESVVLTHFAMRDMELHDFCVVAIETGLRLTEIATLKPWQIDLKTGNVHIPKDVAKSEKPRTVVLSDRAIEILKKRMDGKKPNERIWRSSINRTNMSYHMSVLKVAIGYEGHKQFVFHTFRHTRATRLAAKSMNPFVVQDQLGHADIKTSMRYIHMAKADMNADSWRNA